MPETIRQQIINAIDVRLKTILVSNGFKTNLGLNVFEWRVTELTEAELPALIYRDTESAVGDSPPESFDRQRQLLDIEIDVVVSGSTAPADLRKAIGDVMVAIGSTREAREWNDLAEDTIQGSESISIEHEERRVAGARLFFSIQYVSGIFNPYSL